MYQVGQSVVYGDVGVYCVETVKEMCFDRKNKKDYYVLQSAYTQGKTIYVPVDKTDLMRTLSPQQDVLQWLKELPDCVAEKRSFAKPMYLAEYYKQVLGSHDPKCYLRQLKEIACKKEDAAKKKRRLSRLEVGYEQKMMDCLGEEFGSVLHISFEEAKNLIGQAIKSDAIPKASIA